LGAAMTTLTMRMIKGAFLVTGLDGEPMEFKSRREAREWCVRTIRDRPLRDRPRRQTRRQETAAEERSVEGAQADLRRTGPVACPMPG